MLLAAYTVGVWILLAVAFLSCLFFFFTDRIFKVSAFRQNLVNVRGTGWAFATQGSRVIGQNDRVFILRFCFRTALNTVSIWVGHFKNLFDIRFNNRQA